MKKRYILKLIIELIMEFECDREQNGGEDNLSNFLDWLKNKYISENL